MAQESLEILEMAAELARRVRRETFSRLQLPGASPGRLRALRVLSSQQPMRLGQLAAELGVAPRSVTTVADELAASGLIRRIEDPNDRRATIIETTPLGDDTLAQAEQIRLEVVSEVLAKLTPAQRQKLHSLLSSITA